MYTQLTSCKKESPGMLAPALIDWREGGKNRAKTVMAGLESGLILVFLYFCTFHVIYALFSVA